MRIGGYTDNVGDPAQNLELSKERADAVMAEEVRRGLAPDRLTAEGYGEQHPVADNSTEAGRAQNRRIAMRITQK
jgi:OOP family OmpA-OmpF porin